MARSETFQQVMIRGVLEKDTQVRALESGTQVANLTVLTEGGYKDRQGEWKTKNEYHRIVVFGAAVSGVAAGKKGDLVSLVGQLETRSWDDKETGGKKYSTEIKADRILLLGPAGEAAPRPQSSSSVPASRASSTPVARAAAPPQTRSNDYGGLGITEEDIPF